MFLLNQDLPLSRVIASVFAARENEYINIKKGH